ncbi:hypothetical protein BgiMline_026166, partial [Biomphalaria glabrata]
PLICVRVEGVQLNLTVSTAINNGIKNALVSCYWKTEHAEVPVLASLDKNNQSYYYCIITTDFLDCFLRKSVPRYSFDYRTGENAIKLFIHEVEESDMGEYSCQVQLENETIFKKMLMLGNKI